MSGPLPIIRYEADLLPYMAHGSAHPYLVPSEDGLSLRFPSGRKIPNDRPARRYYHASNHLLNVRRIRPELEVVFPDVLYEVLVSSEEAVPFFMCHLEEKLRSIRGVIRL